MEEIHILICFHCFYKLYYGKDVTLYNATIANMLGGLQ